MSKTETTPAQMIEQITEWNDDPPDWWWVADDRMLAIRSHLRAAQETAKALHECYLFLCDELSVSDAYPENKKFCQRVIDALTAWQQSGGAVQ